MKFGSEVNEIMDQPIASYFPVFSVIGSQYPEAYKKEAKEEYGYQQEWFDHAKDLAGKFFPEVKWQLPEMRYFDKFGTNLSEDDSHFSYRGFINARDINGLTKNDLISNSSYFVVHNNNVVSPQVFWLSPIFYAFDSIGYKLIGKVPDHPLFKRLLLLSFADNMVKIPRKPPGEPLEISSVPWTQRAVFGVIDNIPYQTWAKELQFTPNNAGEHVLRYDLEIVKPLSDRNFFGVQIYKGTALVASAVGQYSGSFEGQLHFTVDEVESGEPYPTYTFVYHSFIKNMPAEYEIGWYQDLTELDFYDMHPTIEFDRYLPDWTTADYLNKFQKMFNLKIDIDDIEKTIAINFNIEDYLFNGKLVPVLKSLKISDPKNIEAESYYLKYANPVDVGQFVSLHPEVHKDENTKIIETDFKYIPYYLSRAKLSKDLEDRDGYGLLIYDPATHPGTVESYAGINLQIPGLGGIYQNFHKPWILFRLNAASAVLEGPFSKTELYQISKYKKILVDHQVWMVKAIDYKENSIALFETELEVESVSY